MATEQEYTKFKSLLEYFVAHLEYVASKGNISHCGYEKYIHPLVTSQTFKKTGTGYSGQKIQAQIAAWEEYAVGKIAINCTPQYGGNYKTRLCYLNWIPTGLNVTPQWNNDHITSLALESYQDENKWTTVVSPISLSELGLYDDQFPNDSLKNFFDSFERMLIEAKQSEKWFPADYTPGFSIKDWKNLLTDPEVFNKNSLEIMKRMLDSNEIATCTQLAKKYGESVNFYKNASSALAERIFNKKNCPLQKRKDGSPRWWTVLYLGKNAGKDDAGSYLWKLRPELAEALKQIDLSGITLYANGKNNAELTLENPMITELKDLLLSSKQIILTGAPGTGKTYLAKQIAYALTGDDEENSPHVDFCQFHPSFDYTDFVEGLRPTPPKNDTGTIGFERKDGIFKAFCKKALGKSVNNFDEAYSKFADYLSENHNRADALVLTTPAPASASFRVFLNSKGCLSLLTGKKNKVPGSLTPDKIKTFLTENPYEYWAGYYLGVIEYLKKNFNLVSNSDKEEQKYVFIIDEVNRGDISKIFGELFYAIDPGYRGKNGKVRTQYSNLLENTDDPFKDGFYIPENVYIIGTMNDIDRSVESMDFAIRRRFTWKEIEAKDAVSMWDDTIPEYKDEAFEKMTRLNEVIEQTESLSKAFHIGPAYFLKLKEYNGDFQKLWDLHIMPLLKEYLRGTANSEKELERFKNAYESNSTTETGEVSESDSTTSEE